jgi:mannose/fructose/N-acetylgalactosamine-specific phosphotransferase system component IIB
LCSIDVFYENTDNDDFINDYKVNDLFNNVNCVALYLRLQFGGFNGEKKLINKLINQIINNKIIICDDEIVMDKYQIYERSMDESDILSCAIDFHCFPKMIEKVLSKIKNDNPNVELNEDDIRNYIWVYDSNVNSRRVNVCNKNFKSMDDNIWNFIIKPKCDIYRYYIMKLLNLKKLL